jgi:hypothetical protein
MWSEMTTSGYGDLKAGTAVLKGDEGNQAARDTASMLGVGAIWPDRRLAHCTRNAGIAA